jgi:hypothetical protein
MFKQIFSSEEDLTKSWQYLLVHEMIGKQELCSQEQILENFGPKKTMQLCLEKIGFPSILTASKKSLNILVIDDEKQFCETTAKFLGIFGYTTDCVCDPIKVVKNIAQLTPSSLSQEICQPSLVGQQFVWELMIASTNLLSQKNSLQKLKKHIIPAKLGQLGHAKEIFTPLLFLKLYKYVARPGKLGNSFCNPKTKIVEFISARAILSTPDFFTFRE